MSRILIIYFDAVTESLINQFSNGIKGKGHEILLFSPQSYMSYNKNNFFGQEEIHKTYNDIVNQSDTIIILISEGYFSAIKMNPNLNPFLNQANKKIIPILVEKNLEKRIPPNIQYIDGTTTYSIDELIINVNTILQNNDNKVPQIDLKTFDDSLTNLFSDKKIEKEK